MSCLGCGAAFEKATAKFCGRCGLRRKLPDAANAAADAPPPALNSTSGPSPSTSAPSPPVSATTGASASSVARAPTPPAPTRHAPYELLYDCLTKSGLMAHYPSMEAAGMHDDALAFVEDEDLTAAGIAKPFERRRLLAALQATCLNNSGRNHAAMNSSETQRSSYVSNGSGVSSLPADVADVSDASAMTLSPGAGGLSPEALETSNADALRGYCRGTLLGRGTFGSVYMSMLPTGRFAAVKEIGVAPEGMKPDELVSISREITMMRRLRHDNICEFFGCAFEPKERKLCLFMELVTGGSLSGLVKRFRPIPTQVICSWTKQLLVGLAYLHKNHIMHRDVKADNVLVDINSRTPLDAAIKLADFGAAKRLSESASKTVCGTPYWLAPEVLKSQDGYAFSADVWSLGCTVCEMFTGKPPWPAKSNIPATILMIATAENGPTERPTEADGATPEALDFIAQCFIIDPKQRPTCEALLAHPWFTTGTNATAAPSTV